VHLEGKGWENPDLGPADVVLGYRHPRKMERLAKRADGRLRVVDSQTAYFRLRPDERDPESLFAVLQHLLRRPERSI
jgi:hypothetical protein